MPENLRQEKEAMVSFNSLGLNTDRNFVGSGVTLDLTVKVDDEKAPAIHIDPVLAPEKALDIIIERQLLLL